MFIETPMQRKGRRVARWLDARYGEDVPPWEPEALEPVPVPAEASSLS